MSKSMFAIVYWSIGFGIVLIVFLLFNLFRKKLIQMGHDFTKKHLDKMDNKYDDNENKK